MQPSSILLSQLRRVGWTSSVWPGWRQFEKQPESLYRLGPEVMLQNRSR